LIWALGRGVKIEEEEMAAVYVTHLVVDAAFVHNCCRQADIEVGAFPYDYLVDKLFPPEEPLNKLILN